MLGLLKMKNEDLKKAILSNDKDNVLADNTINQMIMYVATSEELAALAPFKNDPSKLAAADQYMLVVCFLLFYLFLDCLFIYFLFYLLDVRNTSS